MITTAAPVILTISTPLAGALLTAWDAEGTVAGEHALQDVLRIDLQRVRSGLPSIAPRGAHELL